MRNDICVITETWLKHDRSTEQAIEDFQEQNGYKFIRRDRGGGKRGGGVAICYNTDTIEMNRIRLPPTKYEIVGAIGRRMGQRRKVAVLGVYLPPALRADQVRRCLKDINDAVLHLKQKYTDPYLVVAGDFNKQDLRRALADHSDIKQIQTGPTRGATSLIL